MGMFTLLSKLPVFREPLPYWVEYKKDDKYKARQEYLKFIKKAKEELKIVCGECDENFYDSNEFLGSLETLLNSNGKIHIAFHKGKTPEEGSRIFKERYVNFNKYLSSLPDVKKENIKLHWLPKRPEQHYLLVDSKHLIVEKPHKNGEPRPIFCVPSNLKEGKWWEKLFDDLIERKGKDLIT